MDLVRGLVGVSQFKGFEADFDVETSLATVRPIKPSVFVVEHHGLAQTDVNVRDGTVEVLSDDGIEKVKRSMKTGLVVVRREDDDVTLHTAKAEPKSGFDDWNKRRDKLLELDGRSTWQNWMPSHVGFGIGYGHGWGNIGWRTRYRTTIHYRASPRGRYYRPRQVRH